MGNYDFSEKRGHHSLSRPEARLTMRGTARRGQAIVSPLFDGCDLVGRSAARRRRSTAGSTATTAATTSAASATTALRTSGNGDVLLAIQHKGHGRPHLVDVEVQIQKLLAGIGAIDLKVAPRAGEYEVARG